MDSITIDLPWPSPALSSNARGHSLFKAKAIKQARKLAWGIALSNGIKNPMPDAELHFTYHPPSYRGDAQNVPHMLKAYIDGIADAMNSDDKGFKVFYPLEFSEKTKGGKIICVVKPRTVLIPHRGEVKA